MLPNVQAEERSLTFHDRAVLVWCAGYCQFAIFNNEPSPAAAKTGCSRFCEIFFEFIEAAELAVDGISQCASRLSAAVWSDNFPEQGVVSMAAAVVANRCADAFRYSVKVSDQILKGFALKLRSVLKRRSSWLRRYYGGDHGGSPSFVRRYEARARRLRKEVLVIEMP